MTVLEIQLQTFYPDLRDPQVAFPSLDAFTHDTSGSHQLDGQEMVEVATKRFES